MFSRSVFCVSIVIFRFIPKEFIDKDFIYCIIGDGSKPLTEFDDALFEAMVAKVIIISTTEFEFIFESGQKVKAKASK